MTYRAPLILYFLLIFIHGSLASNDLLEEIQKQNNILNVDEAFMLKENIGDKVSLFSWNIAPKHYLYLDDIRIQYNDADIIYKIKESYQSRYDDMFFGNVPILRNKFSISISMPEIENIDKDILKVSYRGCAEAGFCYPMETVSFRISYKIL